jgi:hypothetical protein
MMVESSEVIIWTSITGYPSVVEVPPEGVTSGYYQLQKTDLLQEIQMGRLNLS